MIENNPSGQLLYVLRWEIWNAGFLMLTPMNDGSYLRCCRFNRTKEEPLIVKDWEYPIL